MFITEASHLVSPDESVKIFPKKQHLSWDLKNEDQLSSWMKKQHFKQKDRHVGSLWSRKSWADSGMESRSLGLECQEGEDRTELQRTARARVRAWGYGRLQKWLQNFHGGPVAKTPRTHHRRPGFDLWWENY